MIGGVQRCHCPLLSDEPVEVTGPLESTCFNPSPDASSVAQSVENRMSDVQSHPKSAAAIRL